MRKDGRKTSQETGKKKIMMRVMKNVMGWRKEEVALEKKKKKSISDRGNNKEKGSVSCI